MPPVRADALAKINLHLAVRDRRADGYHELTTVFQSIALHDTVVVELHDGPFTLRCTDPAVPADDTNLVWRAAAALAEALGRAPLGGVRITLEKRVAVQAGLGGGSADAMATLRALGRAWDAPCDHGRLMAIGRTLGADVPFFVEGGTALGAGRGDELTPLVDLPAYTLVLVRPPFGVATGDAYRWVDESRVAAGAARAPSPVEWPASPDAWRHTLGGLRNDFEPVISGRFPAIGEITAALRDHGASLAVLSGSGSAVVGLFEDSEAAAGALRVFDGRPAWRCWMTSTVARGVYRSAIEPQSG